MNIKEESLMPHVLTVIGIVLGWGDFLPPPHYKGNKGSTKKKKKIITGCMEMKTFSLFISFSKREREGQSIQRPSF